MCWSFVMPGGGTEDGTVSELTCAAYAYMSAYMSRCTVLRRSPKLFAASWEPDGDTNWVSGFLDLAV